MTEAERDSHFPAAVLWDMDGTLVDTEPLWMAAQAEIAREAGIVWTEADAHDSVGSAMPATAAVLQGRGVPGTVDEIVDRLVDRVVAALEIEIPWLPGARRLLAELAAASVPCALVTMAYSPVANRVAATAGTAFAAVVAGDHVTQGKPHPEPYLRAAHALGVDPGACVAVEDSLNGTRSAQAAGVREVVVVPGVVTVPPAPGRRHVDSLSDLDLAVLGT